VTGFTGMQKGAQQSLQCSIANNGSELCPALEPPAQQGHGPVGAGPEEGYKNDLKAGAPLV